MRFLISVAEVNRGSSAKRSLASRSDAPTFTAAKTRARRDGRGAEAIGVVNCAVLTGFTRDYVPLVASLTCRADVAFGRKAQFDHESSTFLKRLDLTATTWSGRERIPTERERERERET